MDCMLRRRVTMKHAWFRALVLIAGVVMAGPAWAQDPVPSDGLPSGDEAIDAAIEAKKRYASGQKSVAQRQFVEAALHFEAAHSYAPSGVSLISAAIGWESANLPQRAADAYARALDEPGLRKAQIAHAKGRLEALERSLATLGVSGDEGIRVQLDDNVDVQVPARLHGSPGFHRLAVWSKGKIIGRRDMFLRLARPEATTVPWRDDPPPPPPPPPLAAAPAPEPPRVDPWKFVGGTLIGAGVASAAGGLFLQLSADETRAASARGGAPEAVAALRSTADTTQAYAFASWITAGVFIAGGLSLVFWPRGAEKTPLTVTPTAGGALVQTKF